MFILTILILFSINIAIKIQIRMQKASGPSLYNILIMRLHFRLFLIFFKLNNNQISLFSSCFLPICIILILISKHCNWGFSAFVVFLASLHLLKKMVYWILLC